MSYDILNKINTPQDLKNIDRKEIPALCKEIREFLVDNVERQGGHLASNLGVTELTVAMHRVFDSPNDHFIFDVGHQSYVHKILTGRKDKFDSLRKTGGLCGFTSMRESEHDAFGAGHSSTSVSAGIGYAESDMLRGRDNYTVVLLGDGAYTGGMVHEALNNANPDSKLVIILNENGMSISVNKGHFASYLSNVRVSKSYRRWKRGTKTLLDKLPLIGKPIGSLLAFLKTRFKALFFSSNYFEDLGLYYIGPVDGNDYGKLEKALKKAKTLNQCVIVHVKTQKGKGYEPAENSPDGYHSVYSSAEEEKTFHSVFADKLISLAENDEKILGVTAAMGLGTGLSAFGKAYPNRYYDVGIAEEHALTFSAGLAAAGEKPYAAIYSTFLQRGYDNIIHDICLQNLPVKIMIDRAGLAVSDGATHHGIFDVAFLSHIPNMTILAPITYGSLEKAIEYANACESPVAIRYPNSSENAAVNQLFYFDDNYESFGVRTSFSNLECPEYLFITYGKIINKVIEAYNQLKSRGISVGIILLEKLKPYGEIASKVKEYVLNAKRVVFVEEGIKNGGAAMLLKETLFEIAPEFNSKEYHIVAIDDNFASPTTPCDLYDALGMSPEKLVNTLLGNQI